MNRSATLKMACGLFGVLFAGSAFAADGPGGGPGDGPGGETKTLTGIVQNYNLDRRGSINGIIIKDGDQLEQLNVPPDQAASIKTAAPVGEKIQATAAAERGNADHPVYHLQSLTGPDGKELTIDGPHDGQSTHVEGTIKTLNYTPRGEVDGAILDSGDFVQVGPGGALDAGLAVGQKISVDGNASPMSDGHKVINARSINGTEISGPPHGDGGGPPDGGGPGGGGGMGGPPPGN